MLAINNLSLAIEGGIIFGIIGPNGSGKTTFFNLVTGVYTPNSGKVIFKGRNIRASVLTGLPNGVSEEPSKSLPHSQR